MIKGKNTAVSSRLPILLILFTLLRFSTVANLGTVTAARIVLFFGQFLLGYGPIHLFVFSSKALIA